MTYSADFVVEIIEHKLKLEHLAIEITLDGWEYILFHEPYQMFDTYVIELLRAAADIDRDTEEVQEYKTYEGTTTYWATDTVWDMIKLKWLRFFRSRLGLTAPFFRPQFIKRYTTYEHTAPYRIQRTNVTRVVAEPGTRVYRAAHYKTGNFKTSEKI